MDILRRSILKGASAGSALAAAMSVGLLKPTAGFANERIQSAFDAKDLPAALKAYGVGTAIESKDIRIQSPEIAESGSVVPVGVSCSIPGASALSVFIDKNPFPLAAEFRFLNGALAEVSTRVKMGATSPMRVVAKSDGRFYTASKEIKVTAGGCGSAEVSTAEAQKSAKERGAASPMKIRAQMNGDVADIKVLMAHPMESGQRKDFRGTLIPAHYIDEVTLEVGGKVVVLGQLGPSVSTNPVFGFKVRGARVGDKVVAKWKDNKGETRSDQVVVAA